MHRRLYYFEFEYAKNQFIILIRRILHRLGGFCSLTILKKLLYQLNYTEECIIILLDEKVIDIINGLVFLNRHKKSIFDSTQSTLDNYMQKNEHNKVNNECMNQEMLVMQ